MHKSTTMPSALDQLGEARAPPQITLIDAWLKSSSDAPAPPALHLLAWLQNAVDTVPSSNNPDTCSAPTAMAAACITAYNVHTELCDYARCVSATLLNGLIKTAPRAPKQRIDDLMKMAAVAKTSFHDSADSLCVALHATTDERVQKVIHALSCTFDTLYYQLQLAHSSTHVAA